MEREGREREGGRGEAGKRYGKAEYVCSHTHALVRKRRGKGVCRSKRERGIGKERGGRVQLWLITIFTKVKNYHIFNYVPIKTVR